MKNIYSKIKTIMSEAPFTRATHGVMKLSDPQYSKDTGDTYTPDTTDLRLTRGRVAVYDPDTQKNVVVGQRPSSEIQASIAAKDEPVKQASKIDPNRSPTKKELSPFEKEFASARKQGKETFTWHDKKGKPYQVKTNLKGEVKESENEDTNTKKTKTNEESQMKSIYESIKNVMEMGSRGVVSKPTPPEPQDTRSPAQRSMDRGKALKRFFSGDTEAQKALRRKAEANAKPIGDKSFADTQKELLGRSEKNAADPQKAYPAEKKQTNVVDPKKAEVKTKVKTNVKKDEDEDEAAAEKRMADQGDAWRNKQSQPDSAAKADTFKSAGQIPGLVGGSGALGTKVEPSTKSWRDQDLAAMKKDAGDYKAKDDASNTGTSTVSTAAPSKKEDLKPQEVASAGFVGDSSASGKMPYEPKVKYSPRAAEYVTPTYVKPESEKPASQAADTKPAETDDDKYAVRSTSGKIVATGTGGKLRTDSPDEIANRGPFGIPKTNTRANMKSKTNEQFGVSNLLYSAVMEVMQKGSKPRHEKEKQLAAMHGDPDVITHGDILKARGVKMKEEVKENKDTPGNSYEHQCAIHVKSESFGEGRTITTQHADPDDSGNIAWYDVMFEHGIEKFVPTDELEVLVSESHMHSKRKMKKM